jgi:hypothetical protein
MDNSNTFSIYSDETGLFDKRFQAIGLVSGPTVHLLELRDKLRLILNENCITEIKFVEVRTHHPKLLAAQGFIERSVTEYANRQKCRIDVLVWDTQDLRRAIRGRDDVANQVYSRHRTKESGVQFPEDIHVESLSNYQIAELRRLQGWIYERRTQANQEKDRVERQKKREEEATKMTMERPALFEF